MSDGLDPDAGYRPRVQTSRRQPARRLLASLLLAAGLGGCAATGDLAPPAERQTFAERCAHPAVVRCVGFDSPEETAPFLDQPGGGPVERAVIVSDVTASGAGALRFEIPSHSGPNTSGAYWQNFSDDLGVQFGEGEEFFMQWRQRFSPALLATRYAGGGGWKQAIIGEGDRPGHRAYSCTQLELVVQNTEQRGFAQMYHSCGGKDGQYQGLERQVPWIPYRADQWMTFQVQVRIGHWYRNDGRYHRDSTIRLWVAEEGQASKLAVDETGYDIANTDPAARYGKIWLLPYHSRKDPAQSHPTAYTWYDELIISRARIADPAP
jgi:hypothetical protein